MVTARYPIETWTRPQLEDHFHNVVEELQNAQRKVKEQEKQITTFNSRFRKNLLERKTRDEKVVERSKYDDVVKENQILDMKLKAAKQQLLIYTAPSARAATASMMTGRSTFRQPPSTWRQRAPLTGGTTGSIDRPPSAPILRKKSSEGEKLQLATDEKLTIVKLNRTLKNKNDEIAELKFTIEKLRQLHSNGSAPPSRDSTSSSKRSSNNNNEDEDDDDEKSEMSEMSEMSDSARSATPVIEEKPPRRGSNGSKQQVQPPRRVPDQSEKVLTDKLRMAESDLQMIREECEVLKKANERLFQQSLSKSTEYGARESIEEKKKIVSLEEQLKETERRIKESEHKRREDQKKFEAMRLHYKTKHEHEKAEKKQMVNQTTVKVQEDRNDSPPPIVYEPLRKRPSQSEISRLRKADDDLLQKLYREVADILQSHDVATMELTTLGPGENSLAKWQKLYSELYEELEKIRNMLVVQYDINKKQTNEITILKDELERLKTLSAERLLKSAEETEEKQKKIYMLEEQIRTIAYSGQQPVKLLSNQVTIPTPRINTDLSMRLIHVKPSASLTSKFFFSLEFFDFQLETTPIMAPKQQKMDFTAVYDVLVSNLLIHYLQTNGITIEMYRPASNCYKLLAAATVSLIPLFEENVLQKFCSEIVLKSVESGVDMCTLRYEIEVSQPISDSFKKFKNSEMARNLMTLKLETTDEEENSSEPLTIMVNRVLGLDSLGRDHLAEFCVVYEFLSFSPYFTDFTTSSEVRSKRDIEIPKTDSARSIFENSNISFFLVENVPKQDGVVGILHLPLLPLCKLGGSIRGTFPMLDPTGNPSSLSLDVCLLWKHEIPSSFSNTKKELKAERKSDTPILPQPIRRTSKQFDVTPVKPDEPIIREGIPGSPAVIDNPKKPSPPSSAAPVPNFLPDTFVPSSPSSSETSFSNSSKDIFSPPQKNPEPLVFEYQLPPAIRPETERNEDIVFDDDDDIESVSAKSSHRDQEPLVPEIPKLESGKSLETDEAPESSRRTPSSSEEPDDTPRPEPEEEHFDEREESKTTTPVTQRSVEEIVEEDVVEEESEEERERELKTEELKSLLGVLPPIAKPRNIPVGPISLTEDPKPVQPMGTTRIVFEPKHHSIPPSESSSTSSPRRAEKPPVPLPDYKGRSLIKVRKPVSPTDNVVEPNMKVTLELESFELVKESKWIGWTRENTKFIVDWSFLDFVNEQSRSTVFDFPKRLNESVPIGFRKEYTLTRGQCSLLRSWFTDSLKIDFSIVKISPGGEEELGFGALMLVANNTQLKSVVVDIVSPEKSELEAELQMTIHFSRELLEMLKRAVEVRRIEIQKIREAELEGS